MQINAYSLWSNRIVTFALAALAAGSVAYWALKGMGTSRLSVAPPVALASAPPADPQAVARALGGGLVVAQTEPGQGPPASSRFVLAGVVANSAHGGAALISVDGEPAKPFRIGAAVDGRLVLQSVAPRRAVLAANLGAPAEVTLELPLPGK
jgi:general secretion pathway protein C